MGEYIMDQKTVGLTQKEQENRRNYKAQEKIKKCKAVAMFG